MKMKRLKKPMKLKEGDTVALVSLSWGGAGDEDILWRYKIGKKRLKKIFGLNVVEMSYTLAGSEYIYKHPEKRAQDLMDAFKDNSINGIISCIGGSDSIRILPYINSDVISKNPKIFMGYSDTTITHFLCYHAGLSSFYRPSLLVDFAENVEMNPYTIEYLKKTLFSSEVIGKIEPSEVWTSIRKPWKERLKEQKRIYYCNRGYEILQGDQTVMGHLLGGCFETFHMLRGTKLFPKLEEFNDSILFFETSEEKPPIWYLENELRFLGSMGILERIKGMIWGKPQDEQYYTEYKTAICKVMKEFGREDMPILYNVNFGHTEPKICIPYGALAQIDCENITFSILQPGVL